MSDTKPNCFVVIGFGKKTDYESGRTLDLDKTYDAIIKPAVEKNGYKCFRAKDISHSGVIDKLMYEMLLLADLVIADISTGNVNAIYELGVRHALRPYSTIVMKENKGKLQFDLDHTNMFIYEHLGQDIGYSEAIRASEDLSILIKNVSSETKPDSPVYTYIPSLNQPNYSKEVLAEKFIEAEEVQEKFTDLLKEAEVAAKKSEHKIAAEKFKKGLMMSPNNSYLQQQAALHTYKSKVPSELTALINGLLLLEPLEPEKTNDPETLGLTGAIYKRLWQLNKDMATLDKAISFYSKGFQLRGDYYNGENAATCLEQRSKLQNDPNEGLYDRMTASKIREEIIRNLKEIILSEEINERLDRLWIYATLANCSFALGQNKEGEDYEAQFIECQPADWQIDTYDCGKKMVMNFYNSEMKGT